MKRLLAVAVGLTILLAGCEPEAVEGDAAAKDESLRLKRNIAAIQADLDQVKGELAEKRAENERIVEQSRRLRADLLVELDEARTETTKLTEQVKELEAKAALTEVAPEETSVDDETPEKLKDRMQDASRRLSGLAAVLMSEAQYDTARLALLVARQLGATAPAIDFNLATTAAETGQYEAAEADYLRVADALKDVEGATDMLKAALLNAGVAREHLDDPKGAAELYERAIAVDDSYAAAYYNLGSLYAGDLKDPAKAVEMLRKHVLLSGKRAAAAEMLIQKLSAEEPPAE